MKTCLGPAPPSLVTCKLSSPPHPILLVHGCLDDSIYAMNGKSVEVDNTDAEGRLILSGIILSQSSILLEY